MRLFEDWAAASPEPRTCFAFIDYIEDLPTLKGLFVRNLPDQAATFRQFTRQLRESVARIEELAQVIFFMAIEDALPEHREYFGNSPWINIEAISLHPDRWERDGLFRPKTGARDLRELQGELSRLFVAKSR